MIKIISDKYNNDVLINNDQEINLHKHNTSNTYQQKVLENVKAGYNYEAYQINNNIIVLKEIKSYNNFDEINYNIINNEVELFYTSIDNAAHSSFLSFNEKYIVVVEREYDCPLINVLAAYDIERGKYIDCSSHSIKNELADGVVKYRRCLYDVIASVLTDQILMIDKQRLFSFMSFVVNKKINEKNYHDYTGVVKEYIIRCYPGFNNHNDNIDKKIALELNGIYGIDYFKFKKIAYDIPDLSYINDKQKRLVK